MKAYYNKISNELNEKSYSEIEFGSDAMISKKNFFFKMQKKKKK